MAGPLTDDSSPSRSRILVGCAAVSVGAVFVIGWVLLGSDAPREQAPPESALNVSRAPLEPAQEALDAWGRFAVKGDLGELDGHVHPDGPQYAQLRSEAHAVQARGDGGPFYSFRIEDATVDVLHARHARLHADVTLTRPGEAARSYEWQLEFRDEPHEGWKLWTVRHR